MTYALQRAFARLLHVGVAHSHTLLFAPVAEQGRAELEMKVTIKDTADGKPVDALLEIVLDGLNAPVSGHSLCQTQWVEITA